MRKMFFARNDKQIANERFETLIDAVQTHNSDAVKAMFSNSVLREVENIDDSIQELLDYFQGNLLSYKAWAGPDVSAKKDNGNYWKSYDCTYDFETTQDKYRLAMEIITVDTADTDNVGIQSLYIIRFEDDTRPNFAYWGDGEHTPGINIGKTK